MTTLRQAAEQALEALKLLEGVGTVIEWDRHWQHCHLAITALRAALAQQAEPEQEPVALIDGNGERVHFPDEAMYHYWIGRNCTKLYTTPPQRKPLTDEEIYTAYITATNQTLRAQDERLAFAFARALEAAHGIKEKHE